MYTPAAVEEFVNTRRSDSYGVTCYFFKLDDTTGFKMYSSKEKRDYNYALQKLASFWGYGTPCHSRMSVKYYNETYYGFLTGIAELAREYTFFNAYNPTHSCYEAWLNLGRLGIMIGDTHSQNFGYYNGKPVCLDFGQPNAHVYYRSHKRPNPPVGFDLEGRTGFRKLEESGIVQYA